MRFIPSSFIVVMISTTLFAMPLSAQTAPKPIALAIHGGAGTINRDKMTPAVEQEYRAKLQEALQAGYSILQRGGTALDAVQAAVMVMEDSPLFNAGKGAVFTAERTNELDAAVMDGKTLKAGAVAGVRGVKNPVALARLVMDKSPHVMLVGKGAEQFAKEQGLERMPDKYFYTERRWNELLKMQNDKTDVQTPQETPEEKTAARKQSKKEKLPKGKKRSAIQLNEPRNTSPNVKEYPDERKFGTVGAVALDSAGNLAAATSTGGMTNKKYGRVGDCPIIGAGTFADNNSCAVSATGHGEYFIRSVVGYDIAAQIAYKGVTVREAADNVVLKKLVERGGAGGVIAVDAQGNIAMPHNTSGMYRGAISPDGTMTIEIFKQEK